VRFLVNPSVREEAIPVYYDEDSGDDDTDSSLLADYVLLELEQENRSLPGFEDRYVEDSAITLLTSSSVSPPSKVEAFGEDRKVNSVVTDNTPTKVVHSPPPPKDVASWWES